MKKSNTSFNQTLLQRYLTNCCLLYVLHSLYPKITFGLSQMTDEGFYYDVDTKANSISEKDFKKLEDKIKSLLKTIDINLFHQSLQKTSVAKIIEWAKDYQQPYLLEHCQTLKDKDLTVYFWQYKQFKIPLFVDQNYDINFSNSNDVSLPVFKIMKIGGVYWRNQADQSQLQRLWIAVFKTEKELSDYLKQIRENLSIDHRQIGKERDLFMFSDLVGAGLPLWLENGAVIRRQLENFIVEEEIKRDYLHVYTPDIAQLSLYESSGHYPYYKDSMYAPINIDDKKFMLRPMTCPHHFQIYLQKPHSFRELPIRLAELAKLYRHEQSGELSGLMRVRTFTLADAHIFCRPDQAEQELSEALSLIDDLTKVFGLQKYKDYSYRLSLGNRKDKDKYFDDNVAWQKAENILRQVLQKRGDEFVEALDEAAFYGPKIDIQMRNQSGKEETAFTVQYDFVMSKRFDLNYVDSNNQQNEVVVIHRSSIGAIERFIAFLIEFYKGKFPVWLSSCQLKILTVSSDDSISNYALELKKQALDRSIRVKVDDSPSSIGKKIRQSQLEDIPYVLVIGNQELKSGRFKVNLRADLKEDSFKDDESYAFAQILQKIKDKILTKQ